VFYISLNWHETNQQTHATCSTVNKFLLYKFCKILYLWCLYLWRLTELSVNSNHTTRNHITAGSDIVDILFTAIRVCFVSRMGSKHLRKKKLKPKKQFSCYSAWVYLPINSGLSRWRSIAVWYLWYCINVYFFSVKPLIFWATRLLVLLRWRLIFSLRVNTCVSSHASITVRRITEVHRSLQKCVPSVRKVLLAHAVSRWRVDFCKTCGPLQIYTASHSWKWKIRSKL
jgi:hypothetical protein